MHCKEFSSIPGLYLLDASSHHYPQVIGNQDVSRYCQMHLRATVLCQRDMALTALQNKSYMTISEMR